MEQTIKVVEVVIERKTFHLELRENARGRFLRITEEVAGRRDTIIVPATGLRDLRDALDAMLQAQEAA